MQDRAANGEGDTRIVYTRCACWPWRATWCGIALVAIGAWVIVQEFDLLGIPSGVFWGGLLIAWGLLVLTRRRSSGEVVTRGP